MLGILLACTAGGFAVAGLAMPFVNTAGMLANASSAVFDDLPTDTTFTDPSQQSVILAADGSELARFYAENRIVVASDEISQYLKDAIVSIEDERFYQHHGLDPEGLVRAALNNLTGGRLAGGSTITQQYVKNLAIEEGRNSNDPELIAAATERSMSRKLSEARNAIAMEKQMSKDEILTGYINVAMFGPSQYGAEAASLYYYSKHAKDISLPQAAMLAGITQSPGKWNPVKNPEAAKNRRDTVLAKMYELGYITNDEFKSAMAVPIEDMLQVSKPTNGCESAGISTYFCEYVVKDVLASDSWGESPEDRLNKLYRGGLIIHTTLRPDQQQMAFDSVTGQVPINDPSSTEMALSSVEPGTGHILAMVQNTNYGTASDEDPNATTINLNVGKDRGGGTGFQSGSTFKVFTLLEWIRTGHGVWDRVNANNRTFPRASWNISCNPALADDYSPKNIEGIGSGMMTVVESTRRSVNISYVAMANQLDMCNIVSMAEKLGVRRGDGEPLSPNPAAALGANPVTPLSMANAMATLSAGGKMCEVQSFTKIENQAGEVIAEPKPQCSQVIEPELAKTATQVLHKVTEPGATGERAAVPGHDVAGKTGTTNMDWHAWFMGFTPKQATSVWLGHMEGNISMFDTVINGVYNRQVYGGKYPAATFSDFNRKILEGEPPQRFPFGPLAPPATVIPPGRDNPALPPPEPEEPDEDEAQEGGEQPEQPPEEEADDD